MKKVYIETPIGDIIDKLTILEIKKKIFTFKTLIKIILFILFMLFNKKPEEVILDFFFLIISSQSRRRLLLNYMIYL